MRSVDLLPVCVSLQEGVPSPLFEVVSAGNEVLTEILCEVCCIPCIVACADDVLLHRQDKRTLVNWRDPDTGNTSLHVAAARNSVRIAAILLSNPRTDPNLKEVRAACSEMMIPRFCLSVLCVCVPVLAVPRKDATVCCGNSGQHGGAAVAVEHAWSEVRGARGTLITQFACAWSVTVFKYAVTVVFIPAFCCCGCRSRTTSLPWALRCGMSAGMRSRSCCRVRALTPTPACRPTCPHCTKRAKTVAWRH